MRHVLGRAQLGAEAAQGGGHDGCGKIGRQLAAGGGLHLGEHVGGAAAGEIVRDHVRRQRKAGAHELLRYNGGSQWFAVDENAVAVENDHGSPDVRPANPARNANGQRERITGGEDREQFGASKARPRGPAYVHTIKRDNGDNGVSGGGRRLFGTGPAVR